MHPAIDVQSLWRADPSLEVQLSLLAFQAVFWYAAISTLTERLFKPFMRSHPRKVQWTRLNQSTIRKVLFVDFGEEEAFSFGCQFLAVAVQHGVGGGLCLPSLLAPAGRPGGLAASLARHGALCEAGWELQDLVVRVCQALFTREGRKMNPPALLASVAAHHALGLGMVVPMNLALGEDPHYHEFVFLLQFAALTAVAFQQFGFTLDVRTSSGLRQMKACLAGVWAVILWSRILRYGVVACRLLRVLRGGSSRAMLAGGCASVLAMAVLNVSFFVDGTLKLLKFARMSAEGEGMEELAAGTVAATGICQARASAASGARSGGPSPAQGEALAPGRAAPARTARCRSTARGT
mmetsp:Transcript_65800/g.198723  ORF Transcript_65800/g.198723 Transcript_65800/m.198723 type:complete len:351 (+) Transcript_65800:81-1133(+)